MKQPKIKSDLSFDDYVYMGLILPLLIIIRIVLFPIYILGWLFGKFGTFYENEYGSISKYKFFWEKLK